MKKSLLLISILSIFTIKSMDKSNQIFSKDYQKKSSSFIDIFTNIDVIINVFVTHLDPKTFDSLLSTSTLFNYNDYYNKSYIQSTKQKIKKTTDLKNLDFIPTNLNDIKKIASLYCNDEEKIKNLGIIKEIKDDHEIFYYNSRELFKKINLSGDNFKDYFDQKGNLINDEYRNQNLVFNLKDDIFFYKSRSFGMLLTILAKNNSYVPFSEKKLSIIENKTEITYTIPTLNKILLDIARMKLNNIKKCISLLLQHGADINTKNVAYERTPLMILLMNHTGMNRLKPDRITPDIIQFFIDNGANVNATNHNGSTPLMYASGSNSAEVLQCLIDNGANVNAIDHNGNIALLNAIYSNSAEVLQCFVNNGANIHHTYDNGRTYLMDCVFESNIKMVKCLVDNKVDVNATDSCKSTALIYTCNTYDGNTNNRFEIIKYLINNGAHVNAADMFNKTTLMYACEIKNYACETKDIDIIKYLMDKGADVNAADNYGMTTLMYACRNKDIDIIKYLADRTTNMNTTNHSGETVFSILENNTYISDDERAYIIEYIKGLKWDIPL